MSAEVTITLDTEQVHDLLIALDVIEMLAVDGPDADVNATFASFVQIRGQLADALDDAGHVVLNEGIRRPTSDMLAALALNVLSTYRKGKTGELVEK